MKQWRLDDGTEILIRPIRPEDEPLMVRFRTTLSEQSVYLRYFHMIKLDHRVSHERLTRICFVDYDSEMVLVAEGQNPGTAEREILAVGRLNKAPDANEAEFAMLVSDTFQHHGLGTEMLQRLLVFARAEKLDRVTAGSLCSTMCGPLFNGLPTGGPINVARFVDRRTKPCNCQTS